MKTYDFSIIGKDRGIALLAEIKTKTVADALPIEEISFLQFPEDAEKQRWCAQMMVDAIRSGALKTARTQP